MSAHRPNRMKRATDGRAVRTAAPPEPGSKLYVGYQTTEGTSTREGLRCLKRHLARTVWQAMRSAEMRAGLRTDACPAAALARASSGVDIGATSDCGIVFGGSLRQFRSQGPQARVIRPGYALFEDVVWMVSRGVRSRRSPERSGARGEQGHAATSGGLKR